MAYNDIYVYKDIVGGTGDGSSEANAKAAFDINDIAHGNRIWIKEAATPTYIPDFTSITTSIVEGVPLFCICGYEQTPGDGGLATLDMYSGSDIFPHQPRSGWLVFGIKLVGPETHGALGRSGNDGTSYINCYFENTSPYANVNNVALDATTSPSYGCYCKSNGPLGAVLDAQAIGCYADAANAAGGATYTAAYTASAILYSVFEGGGSGDGISLSGVQNTGNSLIWKNTIDNFDKGIRVNETPNIANVTFPVISGNLIANSNTAIQNDDPAISTDYIAIEDNGTYATTVFYSGPDNSKAGRNTAASADPFVDVSINDYQLNEIVNGGDLLIGRGALQQFKATVLSSASTAAILLAL